MAEETKLVFKIIHGGLAAITFVSLMAIIYMVGPWLETKYWPVVSKLTILRMEINGPDQTRVWAYFTKLRACDYIGISWHRLDGKDLIRVPIQLLREEDDTSSPNRPIGSTKAGPWIIGMPYDLIRNNSYVELQHRCHPFWTTTTEFYP